ncbi:MAG: cytochrome c [Campylobacteraceae bacterium]|nr:cytochrome c [Campylobacteraceae bacterium]
MKKTAPVLILFLVLFSQMALAKDSKGEKLFKEYCWGCHHQTAQAFGPSFQSIANKRNRGEIIAQIANPNGTYKSLGYKINSMPAFDDLNSSELEALTDYIYKFKDKK